MMTKPPFHPSLEWREENFPLSPEYDDLYFSADDGLAETREVFVRGNGLESRFSELGKRTITIGELGFGTGLNFLATWQEMDQRAPDGRLLFISTEKHPLDLKAMKRSLERWPELAKYAQKLAEQWKGLTEGFHLFSWNEGRLRLLLLVGDAEEQLAELVGQVDAWYLDGFAPSKNPGLWSPEVLSQVARHSRTGTTFSTYTAASQIRRDLAGVGFTVEKVPGFGRKRERLQGIMTGTLSHPQAIAPWYALPSGQSCEGKTAQIVGGGVAGSALAAALSARGIQCTVLEKNDRIAAEASGNPAGIFTPLMTAAPDPFSRLTFQAFGALVRSQVEAPVSSWRPCGAIYLAHTPELQTKFSRAEENQRVSPDFVEWIDDATASALAGTPVESGGVHYSEAGHVRPADLCEKWLSSPGVTVKTGVEVDRLEQTEGGQWVSLAEGGAKIFQTDLCFLAQSHQIRRLEQTAQLPLEPIRGQAAKLKGTAASQKLQKVLCHLGYLTPPLLDGTHSSGATYQRQDLELDIRDEDNQKILDACQTLTPELELLEVAEARAGLRCRTPDSLPIVGPVPVASSYKRAYADIAHFKASDPAVAAPIYYPGLYVLGALTSRGIIYSSYCAEMIAAMVAGEALPAQACMIESLHPARFWIRSLRKGRGLN